jgi:hypothetical protein
MIRKILLIGMDLFFILAFACLIFFGVARASGTTANLTWTPPTAYTNGVVLPATDIAYYTIDYGDSHVTVTAPATSVSIAIPCGFAYFYIKATTTATAAYPNATSQPSPMVTYNSGIACPSPNCPQNVAAK